MHLSVETVGISDAVGWAIVGTFIVYLLILFVMWRQLIAAKKASTVQNILTIAGFLQNDEVRAARSQVGGPLKDLEYGRWTSENKDAGALVASS